MAKTKNLLDKPNERKVHLTPIPTMGGISIYLGSIIPCLIYCELSIQLVLIIVTISIVFVTGILDDIYDIRALYKYIFQFLAAFILCLSDVRLESLHGLFGIYELNIAMQYLLTILFITGITNAINLMDGINGLVGGLFFINSCILSYLFFINNDINNLLFMLSFSGSILGFLKFNFNKARIFMGDTGSLVIGFFMSIMVIKYLNSTSNQIPNISILLALFILPVFDMIRLIFTRLLKGGSPFKADNNHAHHLLLKSGFNHLYVSIFLYLAQILLITLSAFYLIDFNITQALIFLCIACVFIMETIVFKGLFYLRKNIQKQKIFSPKYKLIVKNLN